MTGLMHYRPNIDGAIYFVRDVLPLILEVRPKAVFYIVGAGATSELKRLAGPNVVVTDTVPDVRPYLNRASAVVVPLRMGGGTRLKVLEALSMTKAVVSTSLGAEGINVRSGTHLILADRPREFADAVLTVMHDRALATGLAERGRELVMREYRWETVVACLESFYHQLLSAGTVARPAIS
jgi:glycosyltransferase involved in cell wall biosynthesis